MAPPILDPDRCYRALQSRDARFDGRFFTGVRTTGVFCRPVCPAPCPKLANCTFWMSAAAAQAAGFRPCLRCRPETAPGTPAWRGSAASVSRALRLIETGALDDGGSVDALAERLGVGARHLRRLFDQHLGASPRAVAKMRRTLFAKQLIEETSLSMTEIAASAGFSSQRRFNACVREVYGRPPSALRRKRAASIRRTGECSSAPRAERFEGEPIGLTMSYRTPFDWAGLVDFFRLRAVPGVECVEQGRFVRTLRTPSGVGSVAVEDEPARARLRVTLRVPDTTGLIEIRGRLRELFDLDADAAAIDGVLARSDELCAHVEARPGMRVPGAFDGFETAVRGILGQQVSVKGATTVAGRIAARWGTPVPAAACLSESLAFTFPGPESLEGAPLEEVGLTRARAETIRGLAAHVLDDPGLLEPGRDLASDVERWVALRGIGPWTAHYVAMRVLREPDALAAGDLVLRKRLTRAGAETCSARDVSARLEPLRPYRAYAAIRLWAMVAEGA